MAERTTIAGTTSALLSISLVCALLLNVTNGLTKDRIAANERRYEMRQIVHIAGTEPPVNTGWKNDIWDLCNGTVLTRARTVGYGGPMTLLIAIGPGGDETPRLRGIRVLRHQETPGLADFLHVSPESLDEAGGWLAALRGRNAAEIAGVDTVAGATISSRAVMRGVVDGFQRAAARGGCIP